MADDERRQTRLVPTLAEVARRAGVSKATASRVLSDSPTPVEPDTAHRVRQAARELGYVPNPHARALASSVSPSVGLLIHEISNPYFSEIASGVLAAAEKHDRMVMICNTRRDPDQELRYVREMTAMRVHALIVAGSAFSDPEYEGILEKELSAYRRAGGRVTLMRRHASGSVVVPDVAYGAALVAEHLLGLGHTSIGVLSGPPQLQTIHDRLSAFQARLGVDGIDPVAIEPADFTREGGRIATEAMLERNPDITAVFALNDLMAVGAIHALDSLGLRAPADVSVIGFNDVPIASDTNPQLTTLHLPLREMGEAALEIALDNSTEADEQRVLKVTLIDRGSTGPARTWAAGRTGA